MQRKILWLAGAMLGLLQMAADPWRASAAVVMNYGADGNDYWFFRDVLGVFHWAG
jgi:hypothetical protein